MQQGNHKKPVFTWFGDKYPGQSTDEYSLSEDFRMNSDRIISNLLKRPNELEKFIICEVKTNASTPGNGLGNSEESKFFVDKWKNDLEELQAIDRNIDIKKYFSREFY